ncbi:putative DEAD/DEAH box DNA helicase (Mer3) [Aspergillus mulundensis]|uniref:DNA 3'-5' helicase n=1 Tax=Aspergillus mulundensis TaxID=1810919 RepID=A0A3D8QVZ2_9EURO|nr:Uncharacterized protein DSM5745_09600 [Aspergillus mulundensis]RDW65861.1 Uncharacterized protein DSM5745_09600 [Aspergillus mulundensis]
MRQGADRPFSIPRQGSGPSWKRKADGQGHAPRQYPASSQSRRHSNSIIDEKLIHGSQVSPFFSKFLRQPGPQETLSYRPPPSTQVSALPTPQDEDFEDNAQLDAFGIREDLELLAQSERKTGNYDHLPASNAGYYPSYQPQRDGPQRQVSQFFSGLQVTPHRSIGSSSSDVDTREASSPLARIHTERKNGLSRGRELEMQRITDIFHPQHTEREVQYPQSITDSPACHDPSTPFQNIPVSVRGIVLLSVRELPDNYRSLFHFPVFNAVQSKCFPTVYKCDDNVVLAAPTGSGKTVVMELAICRLLNTLKDEQFKVVYQAPTKSLCSERFRDWNRKFHSLGLQCAELTGDTEHSQLRHVQNSQIIITTPEKWDSITRKWKDHSRLMQLVKLFLIDEVHTLKEARGATLEAVVSRMKSFGSNVRFVALSATIPNSEDIATWLGRNATSQHVPAHREHFGEEFRPVKLQKFVYGYQSLGNDFAFDKLLTSKLADIIGTHSAKKPIMIFCCTRNSAVTTAKELTKLWNMSNHPARLWKAPYKLIPVSNEELKKTTTAGVAFHHAGLDSADRNQVETGFLEGKVSIICCTSTLAVGVNLPCHLVIIKGTVNWQENCSQEYSDLEIMQMLGRAGRPQFDDSAVAVILTRKERVNHYEKLVSGSESLESCLHLNLIDHLNAEIGLGNVTSVESACSWLAGTFLFVRLRRNPTHYKLKEDANRDDEDEMLRQICEKDIKLLQECGLIETNTLKTTAFGEAMARYCIRYETMKTLLTLKPKSDVAQILAIISQAEEFRDLRLKASERSLYKEINRSNDICYPINVDIALPVHKISLLIQSELGAVEFPSGEQFQKHKLTFNQERRAVLAHANRVIRCVIDCQVHLGDPVAVRNALELARSLEARVWDNSPLQMKQIDTISAAAVRKLVAHGIDSIETLEETEPHLIGVWLSKNPAFGLNVRTRLAEFPKLRVSVKMTGKDMKPGRSPRVLFKAEIAFMNEKCPTFFHRRPVHVCFIAETSDGRLIDFRRISATKVQRNYEIPLSAELKHRDNCITCHVMCDEIAGTSRCATLKPDIPNSCFPKQVEGNDAGQESHEDRGRATGKGTERDSASKTNLGRLTTDELLFGEWLDSEILDDWDENAFDSEPLEPPESTVSQKTTSRNQFNKRITEILDGCDEMTFISSMSEQAEPFKPTSSQKKVSKTQGKKPITAVDTSGSVDREHEKLDNGRWACNHKCKDKTACRHLCCREGLNNPPKVTRKKSDNAYNNEAARSTQLTLTGSITKKDAKLTVTDTSKKQRKNSIGLSSSTQALIQQLPQSKASGNRGSVAPAVDLSSSDYGDEDFEDLPSASQLLFGYDSNPPDCNSQGCNSQVRVSNISIPQGAFDIGDKSVDEGTSSAEQLPATRPRPTDDKLPSTYVVDLVSPEPQEMFFMPSLFDGHERQKRKMTDTGEKHNTSGCTKRAKKYEEKHSFLEKPATGNKENLAPKLTPEAKSDEGGSSLMVDVPAGWEGIDPELLNDFKDIVDFF